MSLAGVLEVVEHQADGCRRAGSELYATILDGVARDLASGGVCAQILADRGDDPLASALALRFLGAVHRVVLEGRAPALARHYPSAGGDAGLEGVVPAFLEAVRENFAEVWARTDDGVQTNEVGRSAVLVGGYAKVIETTGLALRVLEVGASAGLNLRWDHYAYDTGEVFSGDPASPVRFTGVWVGPGPRLPERFDVVERRGCDRNPIDPATEEGRLVLLSYVWPDQRERVDRLMAALEVAKQVPVQIDASPAPEWLEVQLAAPRAGVATVVAHSIVLQYLSADARLRVRGAIEHAGRRAGSSSPVAWLRMEPAGDRAELRLTLWPGGEERLLATAGYHGEPVWWEG